MDILLSARLLSFEAWFLLANLSYVCAYLLARLMLFALRVWRLFHAKKQIIAKIQAAEEAREEA
ncbi:MAG TPA: hypothetical protein PK765_03645 [bacterium]|nr:hypothetical protein [bacterium]